MATTAGLILLLSAVLFAQPAPQQSPADKVVARIDGRDWTADAVRAWVATLPNQVQNAYGQNPADTLSKTLLLQYLAALGELHHLDKQTSVRQNLAWARENLLSQGELNHVRAGYKPSAEETRRFYEDNPQRWEQATVRAIYVSVSVTHSEEWVHAKLEDLRKRLEGGADFAQLARENSDDQTSAERGGAWNPLSRSSEFPEAVKLAIFALRSGEISQPVRQPNGFYLFKLESIEKQPFEEVESRIVGELALSHFNQWLESLKTRFTAQVKDPSYFPPVTEKEEVNGDGDDDDDIGPVAGSDKELEPRTHTPPNRLVVEIDGKNWNAGMVKNFVATFPPQMQEAYGRNALKTLCDSLMLQYLAKQAELHHLDDDSQLGRSIRWSRVNLLAEAESRNSRTSYKPLLEEEQQFYSQNVERWQQARARAILISFSPAAPDGALTASRPGIILRSEAQARAKVEDLQQKLAAGADFAELARLNSDDKPSANKGGKLDPMNRNSPYPKALKDGVFALKPGAVSEPVRQPTGFYLFKLESLQSQPFAEVESIISPELQQTHFNEWLRNIRSRFVVQVEDAQFLAAHPQR
jgi:peptidyl-prolyl cis-trans isomerase C